MVLHSTRSDGPTTHAPPPAPLQALVESPQSQMADFGGVQLSLAMAYAVYTLRDQRNLSMGEPWGSWMRGHRCNAV